MKKALFIMALYLVPFFSFSQEVSNIFEDGTVDLVDSKITTSELGYCTPISTPSSFDSASNLTSSGCLSHVQATPTQSEYYVDPSYYLTFNSSTHATIFMNSTSKQGNPNSPTEVGTWSFSSSSEIKTCPPDDYLSFLYSNDSDGDGFPNNCGDPFQINQVDSCDSNSSNEYLTIPVDQSSGCYPQPDGSICKYNAVDVGSGNQYYAMDLEGNCYANLDNLPDLTGQPQDNPVSEECVSYGNGVLGCPTNPSDVCSSGSSYSGGSIADCQTGCGMVNDQFLCIDMDTDLDGLPDYNDPDIDGDGIPNGDDLDSDGNGTDDPINGVGGGTGSEINLDLGPVINQLKDLNKNFDDGGQQKGIDDNQELTNLNNDYQDKLTGLSEKTASQMGYQDSLGGLGSRTGLTSVLPSNECVSYAFHPAGKTITLDTCVVADKVKPFLTWLFGLLTAWHIFFTINKTLREGI